MASKCSPDSAMDSIRSFAPMDILITMENVFVPGGQSAGTKCVLIAVHFVDSTVRLTGIKIKDIPVTGTDQAGSCVIGGGIIVTDGTVNAGGIQKPLTSITGRSFAASII